MKKTVAVSIITIYLISAGSIISLTSCSEESSLSAPLDDIGNMSLQKNYIPTMNDIEQIAKSLSIILTEEKYRTLLADRINSSSFVEKIVETTILFESEDNNGSSLLAEMLKTIDPQERNDFAQNMRKLKFGLVDIYFPIEEHRNSWSGGIELIITPLNSKMIEENEILKGYKIGGEEVEFTQDPYPDIPVMVVCPSEKNGNYTNSLFIDPLLKNAGSFSVTDESGGTAPIKYKTYFKQVFLVGFTGSGGLEGQIELYAKVSYKDPGGSWSYWSRSDLGNVKLYQGTGLNVLPFEFNRNNTYTYAIELWDDDDWLNGADDPIATGIWENSYTLNSNLAGVQYEYYRKGSFPWLDNNRFRKLFNTDDRHAYNHWITLYHTN